ncbi:MAG: dephospho-CoA kinase [Acidimicrobiales bacterium]
MTTVVGLTGGIGSGKSAVADLLSVRGAEVVDADEIAREALAPGAPAVAEVVEHFGPAVLLPDGAIDRGALARLVFSDQGALDVLEGIVHPIVGSAMADLVRRERERAVGTAVVVVVIPLLRALHVGELGLRAVVVVDCPPETALRRLVELRGMEEADARGRMAMQPDRADRLALADYVVENFSTRGDLEQEVDALWAWLGRLD